MKRSNIPAPQLLPPEVKMPTVVPPKSKPTPGPALIRVEPKGTRRDAAFKGWETRRGNKV